jgi:hypothetical protein
MTHHRILGGPQAGTHEPVRWPGAYRLLVDVNMVVGKCL